MHVQLRASLLKRVTTYFGASMMLTVSLLMPQPVLAQAACSTTTNPPTTYGQVKQSFSAPSTGKYRIWSRIKAVDATNNAYYLQIDGGCAYDVGDSNTIAAGSWTWVDYAGGNKSAYMDVNITAGPHQFTYTGKEPNVELDRVLVLSDLNCVPNPAGNGDDCANPDTSNPSVSITVPSSGKAVTQGDTVTITASASDNVGVTKVTFLVDNTTLGTVQGNTAGSPYTYSWNTASVAVGTHNLTARAYDAANNSSVSTAVSVKVDQKAPVADTVKPTVTLTAPSGNPSVNQGGAVTITADATDNVAVTKVEFLVDNAVVGTLPGSSTTKAYSYSWSTGGVQAGGHRLMVRAYDAANNVGVSSTADVTVNVPVTVTAGDINGDHVVNGWDFSLLRAHDGQNYPAADFNHDGVVDGADLVTLVKKWTP